MIGVYDELITVGRTGVDAVGRSDDLAGHPRPGAPGMTSAAGTVEMAVAAQ
jgi:hypothetical protein